MREILEAVKNSIIRFFDDRFSKMTNLEEEIEHLRTQIQIKDHQIQQLIEKLNSQPVQQIVESRADDKILPEPIVPDNLPWPQRKAMLERADREKFKQYQKERQAEVKTTDELEKELSIS